MTFGLNRPVAGLAGGLLILVAGCAGPGPRMLPPAPVQVGRLSDGGIVHWYNIRKHGRPDFCETYSADGRMVAIGYDRDQDGRIEEEVQLDQVPEGERRHMVFILDSVPYETVKEVWEQGRFRYCHKPVRHISPFPVMTDLSLAEFFHVSPCPGVESEYYDGKKLTEPYLTYASGEDSPWTVCVDYHMNPANHGNAYMDSYSWFGHELRRMQNIYVHDCMPITVGYSVCTSGLGAQHGEDGHLEGLIKVDRMCQRLLYETHGRARFTLFSDHGHYFAHPSRRIPLGVVLGRMGYHVSKRLRGPEDVCVPEFGMVSCAHLYTRAPARVAADAVGIEGVELAAYMDCDTMIILSATGGRARVTKSDDRFRYVAERGDPLEIKPVLEALAKAGQVDAGGFVADRVLFEATLQSTYPDAVARLWRTFHGLVEHTPDVLLSHADGYFSGSKFQSDVFKLVGIHGSLRQISSSGFAMTSEGQLPQDNRMEDLRAELIKVGVPFGECVRVGK